MPAESGPTAATVEPLADRIAEVWNWHLFTMGDAVITVRVLATALLVLLVGALIARFASFYLGQRVLPRLHVERGPASTIQSLVYYLLLLIALVVSLQIAEVPLTAFTFLGGALALGIGFGSQNILNNFISGLIVMLERPIRVGDLVEIQGTMGVVQKIGARATHILSYLGNEIIVPNSAFLENQITNWNHSNDLVRVVVAVGVAYGSPTDQVKSLLLQAAADQHDLLVEPPPDVLFTDFGDNALHFELHGWTHVRSTREKLLAESSLRFRIDTLFRTAQITIAYPQRDIHIDALAPIPVRIERE